VCPNSPFDRPKKGSYTTINTDSAVYELQIDAKVNAKFKFLIPLHSFTESRADLGLQKYSSWVATRVDGGLRPSVRCPVAASTLAP